jgi:predicted transcriptional regulator
MIKFCSGGADMTKDVKIFISNVHQRRERAGLSITRLSKLSGVSLKILEELERGVLPKEMMVDDALCLAKAFQCKPEELFQ